MKTFKIHSKNEIPPKSDCKFRSEVKVSDRFFALCEDYNGNKIKTLVYYDFQKNKWRISTGGKLKILEYYSDDTMVKDVV